jgi:hypothetical protein
MESNHFITSKKGHSYYCNTDHPLVNLCNSLLINVLSGEKETIINAEEREYYEKKSEYLTSLLFNKADSGKKMEFVDIDPSIIEDNIINLKQIVFEVTDACNLKCKYCGYAESDNYHMDILPSLVCTVTVI